MPERILATRPTTENDFQYAWTVYCEAVKPYIAPKLKHGWEDAVEVENFRKVWRAGESQIITVDEKLIGWWGMTISENEVQIEHLYIQPHYQGKGCGTRLVSEMTKQWVKDGKTVRILILKDQRRLETFASRLGFETDGEGDANPLTQIFTYSNE